MVGRAAGKGPRYEVTVHVTGDRTHLPYLMEGLSRLADAGRVELRIRPRGPHRRDRVVVRPEGVGRIGRPYPWSYDLDVVDHDMGVAGRAGIDLQDWRNMFSDRSLDRSDVLFKRMYVDEPVAAVAAVSRARIMPAGITHGAPADAWTGKPAAWLASGAKVLESALGQPAGLVHQVWRRRPSRAAPDPRGPSAQGSPPAAGGYVLFQVMHHGQWGPESEADVLTRSRADVVRSLRARFGDRFVGGIVFPGDPPADMVDCASHLLSDRASYLELVAGAAVVVSTNGFGESPPWKLAEYLEAGAAIVSERQVARLPTPLLNGRHVVEFTGPESCADRCAELLEDPAARAGLGAEAARFYHEHVAPDAAVWRYLTTTSRLLAEAG